ncbi:MAG: hypothetical protein ACI4SC_00740, partial [Candidatus Neoclostridium sp.]
MKKLLNVFVSIAVCAALTLSVACKGADGNGIKSASIEDGRLILVLDNGSKLDLGDVTGAQGDTGEQGPKGDTGEQGPKGDTGEQGPKG